MSRFVCASCKSVTRKHRARGLCNRCYSRLHARGELDGQRKPGARQHYKAYERSTAQVTSDWARYTPPPRVLTAAGLEVATLHCKAAEERERLRRVEVYAEQVRLTGRVRFGDVPPPPPEPAPPADSFGLDDEADAAA